MRFPKTIVCRLEKANNSNASMMKVFTVGLDQKPPAKSPETPPPGYATTTNNNVQVPLPLGPEVAPVIIRKARGYKGVLMVMLAVFLMAFFALTLSEIAYNRQRDENFFRLRWAELKHRLGYTEPGSFDYWHRANSERLFALNRNKEMGVEPLLTHPDAQLASTTTTTPSPAPEPPMVVDSESQQQQSSSQQTSSQELEQSSFVRDARLQFLRTILQKIKQHAEDMGFDGTMQVSVVEMEPQMVEDGARIGGNPMAAQVGGKQQPFRPPFDPKSPAFLDGFGEFHQPTFMENQQIAEQNRAARVFGPWPPRENEFGAGNDIDFPPHGGFRGGEGGGAPFRPDWAIPPQFQRPHFERFEENNNVGERGPMGIFDPPPPPPPPMAGASKSFEFESSPNGPSQEVMGEMYGRKFGRMLQDLIASRLQGFQQMHMNPLMPPQRPSFPIEQSVMPPQQQQQNSWWQQMPPQWQQQAQQQRPPQSPPAIGQGAEFFANQQQQAQPQQQQQVAQQQMQLPQMIFFPPPQQPQQGQMAEQQQGQQAQQQQPAMPQFQSMPFIAPEDRIQIEPPTPNQQQQIQGVISSDIRPKEEQAKAAETPAEKTADDAETAPRGWTHQAGIEVPPAPEVPPMAFRHGGGEQPGRFVPPMPSLGGGRHRQAHGSSENSEDDNNNDNTDRLDRPPPPPPHMMPPPPHFVADMDNSAGVGSHGGDDWNVPQMPVAVDFPAVKFPMMNDNAPQQAQQPTEEQQQHHVESVAAAVAAAGGLPPPPPPAQHHEQAAAAGATEEQQHDQPLVSNPIFFQVDEPQAFHQGA
jgi:hypothetical protein